MTQLDYILNTRLRTHRKKFHKQEALIETKIKRRVQ